MTMYSAYVKMKGDKQITRIDREYPNKAKFIYDLRANGYMVNPNNVKEFDVFEYILNETNCTPEDWKYINRIPAENENVNDIVNNGIQKTFEKKEANFYKKYPKRF